MVIINKVSESDVQLQQRLFQTTNTDQLPIKHVTACRFFKKVSCKHGMKGNDCICPKICKKLVQLGKRQPKGCNLEKNYINFHPDMCINSLRKGECLNQSYRFHHVKGTK